MHVKKLFTIIYSSILSAMDFHTHTRNLIQSLLKWEVLFLHLTTEEKAYLAELPWKMNVEMCWKLVKKEHLPFEVDKCRNPYAWSFWGLWESPVDFFSHDTIPFGTRS